MRRTHMRRISTTQNRVAAKIPSSNFFKRDLLFHDTNGVRRRVIKLKIVSDGNASRFTEYCSRLVISIFLIIVLIRQYS